MQENDSDKERLLYSLKIDPVQRAQPTKSWSRRRKLLLLVGILAAIAVVVTLAMMLGPAKVQVTRAEVVQEGLPETSLTAGGYVVADSTILVSSQLNGQVKAVLVEEGEKVKQGQVLAEIEDNDFRAKYLSAKADFDLAAATLTRKTNLFKQGVISHNEYDEATKVFGVAKAALGSAKYFLDQTKVKSPIDGTVIKKEKEAGEYLLPGITSEGVPGSAVIKVADLRVMNVEMDILESDLPKVKQGQPAMVFPDALPDKSYAAELYYISPQADRQKSIVQVKVRIDQPDDRLKPEMSARVYLLKEPATKPIQRRVVVPEEAIFKKSQGDYVFLVKKDRLAEQKVEVAGIKDGKASLASGLEGDESVVLQPRARYRAGMKVEVKD